MSEVDLKAEDEWHHSAQSKRPARTPAECVEYRPPSNARNGRIGWPREYLQSTDVTSRSRGTFRPAGARQGGAHQDGRRESRVQNTPSVQSLPTLLAHRPTPRGPRRAGHEDGELGPKCAEPQDRHAESSKRGHQHTNSPARPETTNPECRDGERQSSDKGNTRDLERQRQIWRQIPSSQSTHTEQGGRGALLGEVDLAPKQPTSKRAEEESADTRSHEA
jgi:hypothetical protein